MNKEEIMNEYEILKDQLFNERETYNFIDKLGYDDWNKKQVIREYIKHIREENKQLKDNWNKLRETLKNEQLGNILYSDKKRFADIDEILLKMQELEKSDSNE